MDEGSARRREIARLEERVIRRYRTYQLARRDLVLLPYIPTSPEYKAYLREKAIRLGVSLNGLCAQILSDYVGYRGPMPNWSAASSRPRPDTSLSVRVPRAVRRKLRELAVRRNVPLLRLVAKILEAWVRVEQEREIRAMKEDEE